MIFKIFYTESGNASLLACQASIFSVDLTEEKHPPNLYLQVWDADLISADDILGKFTAKTAVEFHSNRN